MSGHVVDPSPSKGPRVLSTLGLTLAAGLSAAVVASFGMMGLYGALAAVGAGTLVYLLRDQLIPVFDDARERAWAVANDRRLPVASHPRVWAWTVVLAASLLAFAAVTAGTKVAIAAAALPVAAAGAWLAWRAHVAPARGPAAPSLRPSRSWGR